MPDGHPTRRFRLPSAYAALTLLLLVPFATTPIPPLLDFPDHVAEMVVLAAHGTDPLLARFYDIHWTVVANSGVELVMPWLLRYLPVWPTGVGVLAVALLLPLAGAAVFSRVAFGRWSPWPLAGGLVAYNTLFLLGFQNFLIGLGLAFMAAAAWVAFRGRAPVRTLVFACLAAVVLFFVHLFALLFFALLAGAHELVALTGPPGRRWPGIAAVLRRLAPDAVVFVLPAALFLGSTLAGTAGPTERLPWRVKLGELFYPFLNYYQTPDRLVGLALLAVMALMLVRRRARVAPEAVIALLALLAFWPFVPHVYKDTGFIDARFPTMMGYLLFAGFAPDRLGRSAGRVLAVVTGIAIATRVAVVALVWHGHNADLAELRQVIARVTPGSAVLAVDVPQDQVAAYWPSHRRNWMNSAYIKTYYHDAALVLTERRAMWPRLFTGLGKQPVVVRPAYAGSSSPEGELPDVAELTLDAPSQGALAGAPYLADWPQKFDYVLLLAAGAAGDLKALRPDRLELLERTEFAALFRVRRTAP